jgi:CheY-like chemotaxis protein
MDGARAKEIQPPVVLIVEDEVILRWQLADCFREAGCIVMEAASAKDAMALCDDGLAVHVLITDIQLNGSGSGWDVAEAFRALWQNIPVIYMSGNASDRTRSVSNSLFFDKPYRSSEVVKASQLLIAARESRATSPPRFV